MSPEIQKWLHQNRSRINNRYLLTRPIEVLYYKHEWLTKNRSQKSITDAACVDGFLVVIYRSSKMPKNWQFVLKL